MFTKLSRQALRNLPTETSLALAYQFKEFEAE